MTKVHVSSLLGQWLTEDIEAAQESAASQPPSMQPRILVDALTRAMAAGTPVGEQAKLFGIAQTILSGTYLLLPEESVLELFGEIVRFSIRSTSADVRGRAYTVAALLTNRARDGLSKQSAEFADLISKAIVEATSPREKSLLSAMLSRVRAAEARVQPRSIPNSHQFKIPDLDIAKAARTVREDIGGDWYQDPWGWPEVEWLVRKRPQKVLQRLRDERSGWTIAIDVSKPRNGVRPGIVINPLDRIAFQSLVDDLAVEALAQLPHWVFGWRFPRSGATKGTYADNRDEWKQFSHRVSTFCNRFAFTAHLDIQSFFPSVDTSSLLAQITRRYRNVGVVDRLETYFRGWHKAPNGSGIPQRSFASSVLAHAVLRPVDTFLDRTCGDRTMGSFACSRWMDDIWIHSADEKELRSCVAEVENILGQVRLSLNADKTVVFEGRDASALVKLVETSGLAGAHNLSLTPAQLLDNAEDAPFQAGLAVSRMVSTGDFSALAHVTSGALVRFTHIANRLARAFRVSGQWKHYAHYFLSFARAHVSRENWSVAAWAEMFPNNPADETKIVQNFFAQNLSDASRRLLIPLAAQRLAAWSGKFGSAGLADSTTLRAIQEQDDVFRLRGLSFAALRAGADKGEIKNALEQADDEIAVEFLKDTDFEPPALSDRFGSE